MNYPDIPNVTFLGDVHLGRRFMEGVPLDRRGEREEMVWAQFEKELRSHNSPTHIQVGDLFDTFDVDNAVVLRAARIYVDAARDLSSCNFFILRGNHDAARSDTRVSSFEVFKAIVAGVPNLIVVDEPAVYSGMGFMPWDPFCSADEQASDLMDEAHASPLKFVVCHCDVKSYGGDQFNVLPLDRLQEFTGVVVTGHDHTGRDLKMGTTSVHVTGSMQPYSHGEDPEHTMYHTVSVDEMYALGDTSNLYLRVLLQPGETPPPIPNCLGYKVQPAAAPLDEAPDITVDFEEFDTTNIFKTILAELSVSAEVQAQVLTKFTESLNA